MLYYLYMFRDAWGGFNLFRYVSLRAIAAAFTAFLICTLLGPAFIRALKRQKIGETVKKGDSEKLDNLHAGKEDTPTMGGLVVVFAIMMAALFWARITYVYIALLLLSTAALAALGFVDDYLKLAGKKGLKSRTKFVLLGVIAVAIGGLLYVHLLGARNIGVPSIDVVQEKFRANGKAASDDYVSIMDTGVGRAVIDAPGEPTPETSASEAGVGSDREGVSLEEASRRSAFTLYFPFFKNFSIYMGIIFILAAALVLTATSNAVNLTDGIDGLAPGCVIMVSLAFVVLSYLVGREDVSAYLRVVHVPGAGEVSIFCAALFGATMGFLWFNAYPAQVFLGDTGALPLGGAIGLVAVITKQEMVLPIAGGIFVMEAMSVILQVTSFRLFHKRIFMMAPLHHHFECKNWQENKITVRFWIIGAILAMFAVATLKLR